MERAISATYRGDHRGTTEFEIDLLADLNGKIANLDQEIARRARKNEISRRLMMASGPISATAIAVLAPPAETFAKGRDFAAWLGLTPLQRSTGGKSSVRHPRWASAHSGASPSSAAAPLSSRRSNEACQGFVARADVNSQAAYVVNRRACQQGGTDRLGTTYQAGDL
jgi:hypothetical protein